MVLIIIQDEPNVKNISENEKCTKNVLIISQYRLNVGYLLSVYISYFLIILTDEVAERFQDQVG